MFQLSGLINLWYVNKITKTTGAKRLAKTENISVRDAEWLLDADAYLQEQWQWAQCGLHHEYMCQQMFLHATATGQSEHECTIHQRQREPLPKWDIGAEPTAMELVGPNLTCQDIEDLYQDVYQLQRLPRRGQCEEATKVHLCKEVIDLIKENLQLKLPSA